MLINDKIDFAIQLYVIIIFLKWSVIARKFINYLYISVHVIKSKFGAIMDVITFDTFCEYLYESIDKRKFTDSYTLVGIPSSQCS